MQIILLSGGSGKRLWPLSNGTRSKQFLKLLQAPNQDYESMVQRITRQISESHLSDSITIATSETQYCYIKEQLGEKVKVVTEPERRDTFPAIALATAYLALEKGCSNDEIVIVMPCDSFVEPAYFETIRSMAELASKGIADLSLMGIPPTYPSTKFGYVIPSDKQIGKQYYKVERFTEKPNEDKAKELIELNAFWNGGVFAFKLGYMMNISRKYIKDENFAEFRNKYSQLPKISFDYEVAEKAESIAVVPYSGIWKDLGTWNTLSEELPQNTFGKVFCGNNVNNTHIINELNIPIVCNGVNNLIIAATPDGIIICEKEKTEDIKKLVEKTDKCQ